MLLLPTSCHNKLIIEAIEKYPAECCGFLLGKEDNNEQRIISKVVVCKNESGTDKEYKISPKEYKKVEKEAGKKKLSLLGIYHSHPDWDAIPSETDLENALPNLSYVIISVFKHQISASRGWRLNENRVFEEEPIITDQNSTSKSNTTHGNHYHSHTTP